MNNMVKAITYQGKEIEGYLGYQKFEIAGVDIPVVYDKSGIAHPIYASTVKQPVEGLVGKNNSNIYYGDVFKSVVKRNGKDVFVLVAVSNIENKPYIIPFITNPEEFTEISSISLVNSEYVCMVDALHKVMSDSVMSKDYELLFRIINTPEQEVTVEDNSDKIVVTEEVEFIEEQKGKKPAKKQKTEEQV